MTAAGGKRDRLVRPGGGCAIGLILSIPFWLLVGLAVWLIIR